MNAELLLLLSALWLGILTSVSPCPLATNVAATSVLARRVSDRRRALLGALIYTAGRMSAYLALALVIFAGVASMPALSEFLRQEVAPFVGPVLILAGMAVLGWLPMPVSVSAGGSGSVDRLARLGLVGEFGIGALFALSFCPISAALFFGSLLPLAVASTLPSATVALYGLGTALPVGVVAVVLVFSAGRAAATLRGLQVFQRHAVRITGAILIGIGVWLVLSGLWYPI